jgi:hypothetical protein
MTEANKPEAAEPTWESQAGMVDEPRQGNYLLGIVAALGAGLVGAAVYAVVATLTDREIGYLAILIGAAVALAVAKIGGKLDIVTGLIAAVIAALAFIVAIFATGAGILSSMYEVGLGEAFEVIMEEPVEYVRFYFEEDVMSFLFLALAVVPAFYLASGLKKDAA